MAGLVGSAQGYSERLLYVDIENEVIQGVGKCSSRPQPISSRAPRTARKPHSRPEQPPRNGSPTGTDVVPALPCLTTLGASTAGGVAALREHFPAPCMTRLVRNGRKKFLPFFS